MDGAVFAEVECRSGGGLAVCNKFQAGNGGWPTVYSFTASTPDGKPFPREMPGSVCDEIVSPGRFERYVKESVKATRGGSEDL